MINLLKNFIIAFVPNTNVKIKNYYKLPLGIFLYIRNLFTYLSHIKKSDFEIKALNISPDFFDRFSQGGEITKHYFLQDIWAAKKVYYSNAELHHDIGSRLDGFIANCLVFTKIVMIDYRPINQNIKNISFLQSNATDMNNIESNSINSLSSLHAIEHFGLGRYGDPINPLAHIEAINEIQRISNGDIYIGVPIGSKKLYFDLHRIFNPIEFVELFNKCELIEFSYIDDENILYENVELKNDYDHLQYGCGLFHFKKVKENA